MVESFKIRNQSHLNEDNNVSVLNWNEDVDVVGEDIWMFEKINHLNFKGDS